MAEKKRTLVLTTVIDSDGREHSGEDLNPTLVKGWAPTFAFKATDPDLTDRVLERFALRGTVL